jgi:hypothetical protein
MARPTGPFPTGPLQRRRVFLGAALRLGRERFGWVIGLASLAFGVTLSGLITWLLGLDWPWALAIVLGTILVVGMEGAYRAWDRADRWVTTLHPTWEFLQDQADTLRAMSDANPATSDWPGFLRQYIPTYRLAAQANYDMAETVGFSLSIPREALRRPANLEEFEAIADAFEEAAQRWKAMERDALAP